MIDYDNLSNSKKEELLTASHMLLRVLVDVGGAAVAEETWGNLADTIHPSLKKDLLLRLLMGGVDTVTITQVGVNMISCIKVIREYTNLSLKESKDVVDSVRYNGRHSEVRLLNASRRVDMIKDLADAGCQAY